MKPTNPMKDPEVITLRVVPQPLYETAPDGTRRPNEARQRERYAAVAANIRERHVREWLSDPANAKTLREAVAEQLRNERTITETAPPATAPVPALPAFSQYAPAPLAETAPASDKATPPPPDPAPADPAALVNACLGHLTGTRPARSPFWHGVELTPPDAA